jgi:hypothetical protein
MVPVALLAVIVSAAPADIEIADLNIGTSPYVKIVADVSGEGPGDRAEPSLAAAPDGKIAHAWQDTFSGVHTRTFAPTGVPLEGRSSFTGHHQTKPAVVFGKTPLTLHENAWGDNSGTGIFAGTNLVPQTVRGEQTDVVAAKMPDGSVLAVWSSEISRKKTRLFGRVLNAAGKPIGNEFRITNAISGSETLPAIAVGAGKSVVAWQSFDSSGKPNGIWAAGVGFGKRQIASRLTDANGLEPSLAASKDGFVLAWSAVAPTGRTSVRAQMLDTSLKPVGDLAIPAQSGRQNAAGVAVADDGTIAVCWNCTGESEKADVYAILFDKADRPNVEPMKIAQGALSEYAGKTRMAWTSQGALAFAWSRSGEDEDEHEICLTMLIPADQVSEATRDKIREAYAEEQSEHDVVANSGSAITFARQAGPHIPPTFNPKDREDPWGALGGVAGIGGGFTAVVNTGWTPPDPHMAVGPHHIGVMTNGQIAFFGKGGRPLFHDEIEDSFGFWGSVGATNFVFDPEIIYDRSVGRWMAMACERAPNGSFFLLAVSDDDDPSGDWFKYRINVTSLGGGGDIDSPNLSTDSQAVYLSADFFTGGQKYLVYILSKKDLIAGDPSPLTRSLLITGQQSFGMPMTIDADAPQYLIEHFESNTNTTVRLHAITDPLGTPTRTTFTLNVPAYGRPENPPQQGTSSRPTSFDSRFWSCVYRNGSLWATHHINSDRVLARWYEIKMNGWPNGGTPELVQSGNIDPGPTVRTFFSSITVDSVGNAAVVCARSSPTEFISMFRAVRRADDPLGTMPDQAIVQVATGPYTAGRWGDYSGAQTDPADERTFWGHHEYAIGGSWRTWVQPFAAATTTQEQAVEQIIPIQAGTITGGLPEIASQDGSFMTVNAVSNPLDASFGNTVDYIATASVDNLAGLDIRTVAKVGVGFGTADIYLLNRQTGLYDRIGTGVLNSANFSTFTLSAPANVNRYVEPSTHQMRMRMTYRLGAQPSTFRPPILIDEIKFVTRF